MLERSYILLVSGSVFRRSFSLFMLDVGKFVLEGNTIMVVIKPEGGSLKSVLSPGKCRVEQVHVSVGQSVIKGQKLFTVDIDENERLYAKDTSNNDRITGEAQNAIPTLVEIRAGLLATGTFHGGT